MKKSGKLAIQTLLFTKHRWGLWRCLGKDGEPILTVFSVSGDDLHHRRLLGFAE
jgi:hypothetical protein